MGKVGAIILAAGQGKRLRPFTENATKCMLKIAGTTLLQRSLGFLKKAGVTDVVLGLGYKSDNVHYSAQGMKVRHVLNQKWHCTNNIETLQLCLDDIRQADYFGCARFFIIEGDIYLGENTLPKLLQEPTSSCAVLPDSYGRKGTSVELDVTGSVRIMRDNAEWNSLSQLKVGNVYLINREDLGKMVEEMPFYGRDSYYEAVIGKLVNRIPLKGVLDGGCREIDNSYDKFSLEEELGYDYSTVRSNWGGLWRTNLKDFFFLSNPFYPTPFILNRLKEDFELLVKSYPSGRRRINQMIKASVGVGDEFPLFAVNGASEAIRLLENYYRDKVSFDLLFTPTFGEYSRFPMGQAGKRPAVAIVTPNNPTAEKADIATIESALGKNEVVVLDISLNTDPDRIYLDLVSQHKNLIVVKSLGKVMGIPGLRLGYVAVRDETIPNFEASIPIWNVNAFAERFLELHLESLSDFEKSLTRCAQVASELADALQKIFPSYHIAGSDLFLYFIADSRIHEGLYRRGIFLADLSHKFGRKNSQYHYRMGIRTPDDNRAFLEATQSIAKTMRKLA